MAYTIAGVVINSEGRYLLVQERKPECYGQWNWPAGNVDDGETVEQAAIREAKEETGFNVELSKKIGEWFDEDAGRTRVLFSAKSFDGQLTIKDDEILGAAWLTSQEIIALGESMRSRDWTAGLAQNNFVQVKDDE